MAKKTEQQIKDEMAKNSAAWHSADAATRKQLEEANKALGSQLGGSFDSGTGKWSDTSGKDLYKAPSAPKPPAAVGGGGSTYKPPANFGGSAGGVGTWTDQQESIRQQMNANSQAWHSASPEERKRLEAANQALAGQLGGSVSFDPTTGYWGGAADQPFQKVPSFDWGNDNATPTFDSKYDSRIDDLLNQILNREDFKYDVNEDPLYQQYKQQYNREGNRAMNDTLASAAAGAGGMNSYAVTAAQQANNYYASQLGDKIPELYQLAYSMYLDDIEGDVRDMGLLQDMDNTQYNRYRDTMSDWRNDRGFAYGMYRDQMGDWMNNRDFNYQAGRDQINDEWRNKEWDYNVGWDQKEWDYNVGRDQKEDERWDMNWNKGQENDAYNRVMDMLNMGMMPGDDLLAAAGIDATQASAYIAKVNAPKPSGGGGKVSGGGGGGKPKLSFSQAQEMIDNGYVTDEVIRAYEYYMGGGSYEQFYGKNDVPKKGTTPVGGAVDNAIYATEKDDSGLNWDSIKNLGIGPVSATAVAEIADYGGVIEDGNGNVFWAPGWNKDNYEVMLQMKKSIGPGMGLF